MNNREVLKLIRKIKGLKVDIENVKNNDDAIKLKREMMLIIQDINIKDFKDNNAQHISSNKFINSLTITEKL